MGQERKKERHFGGKTDQGDGRREGAERGWREAEDSFIARCTIARTTHRGLCAETEETRDRRVGAYLATVCAPCSRPYRCAAGGGRSACKEDAGNGISDGDGIAC